MPILYQNTNPMSVKHYLEVDFEELNAMKKHHRKTEYNDSEKAEVFNLVRKYINPHQSNCMACTNDIRNAKTLLNEFYLQFKDLIAEHIKQTYLMDYLKDGAVVNGKILVDGKIVDATEWNKAKAQTAEYAKKCKCKSKTKCKCNGTNPK